MDATYRCYTFCHDQRKSHFFCRYDVYTGDPVTQKDIRYEQACVLFNLGKYHVVLIVGHSLIFHV